MTEEDILSSSYSFSVLTLELSISPRRPGLSQWRKVFGCQDACTRWAHCFCGIASPRCFQLWELRNVCIMYLHVCISISISISIHLSTCLSVYVSTFLPICLPTYLCIEKLRSIPVSPIPVENQGVHSNLLPFHI